MSGGEKKAFSRLPKDVVPANYNLRLKPDLKNLVFEGHEEITVEAVKATDTIILNSVDIKVSTAKYSGSGQEFSKEIALSYSEPDETLTLKFPEPLKVGTGLLSLTYTGVLNDKMKGFYRSKYNAPDDPKQHRFAAVTQFEPTYARYAFPCWDEPAVKATFDVTLVVPQDRVALSNMPVQSENKIAEGLKSLTFSRTPIMSTYLLAFVVGEYDYVEGKDSAGVLVRVYTPVGKKEQGEFALQVAIKTLPFYHDYFGIAYPLPKLDLIAISDFAAGAMENWGLVTYREARLLVDPVNTSALTKQDVALVVGHELAHQWFGNLVTMEWWTHLWLNEGFASFVEYLCVDHCYPDYDIWTQFAFTDFSRGLELDSLDNSHPIEVEVGHPEEVDEIFDAISYSKGASVIRMLHDYIGDQDFRKGMNAYLTKHAYKNAYTEDLWAALGEASGKPVGQIMTTWTKQMGYPLVKVTGDSKEAGVRKLTITQQKFTADGKPDKTGSKWMIPVSVCTSRNPDKPVVSTLLSDSQTQINIEDPGEWIKLNVGGVGFYRTHYPPSMLSDLRPAVEQLALSPRDRLSLQNDLFALCRAGVTPAVDVLKLVDAYRSQEDNYTVWSDISANLGALNILFQTTEFSDKFSSYVRHLFSPIMKKIGWDHAQGESHLTTLLRGLVIGRLGRAGDQSVIAEARKRFAAHVDGIKPLPADLRQPVYGVVLKFGTEADYEKVLKLYRDADLHEEKVRIQRSLGATLDPALIQRTLKFAIGDEVRSMDTISVIASVCGSVEGRESAWAFLKSEWTLLHGRYKSGFLLARLVKATTEHFSTADKAKDIEEFFAKNPAPGAERNIQQTLESIRLNIAQLARDREAVKQYVQQFE